MITGLSTACFYPMTTEESLERTGALGFRTAEIFFNSFSELGGPILKKLEETRARYGIDVVSVHPFTTFAEGYIFFSEYERRVEDGLELYRHYFDAAARLGARILVLHGGKAAKNIPAELYAERLHRLVRLGHECGITVAHENVVHFSCESVAYTKALADLLGDNFYMTLDIKQCVRAGQDPFAFISTLGRHIVHVHVSDHGVKGDCLPPGEGDFDFRALFRALDGVGYTGAYIIELYSCNFRADAQLTAGGNFLRKCK